MEPTSALRALLLKFCGWCDEWPSLLLPYLISYGVAVQRTRLAHAVLIRRYANSGPLLCFHSFQTWCEPYPSTHEPYLKPPFQVDSGTVWLSALGYGTLFTLIKQAGIWGQVYSYPGPGPMMWRPPMPHFQTNGGFKPQPANWKRVRCLPQIEEVRIKRATPAGSRRPALTPWASVANIMAIRQAFIDYLQTLSNHCFFCNTTVVWATHSHAQLVFD